MNLRDLSNEEFAAYMRRKDKKVAIQQTENKPKPMSDGIPTSTKIPENRMEENLANRIPGLGDY
jgi:hypothetical protein